MTHKTHAQHTKDTISNKKSASKIDLHQKKILFIKKTFYFSSIFPRQSVCIIAKYDSASKFTGRKMKMHIKIHLIPQKKFFFSTARSTKKIICGCHKNHKKSVKTFTLQIDPKTLQCVPKHQKTLIFEQNQRGTHTYHVLLRMYRLFQSVSHSRYKRTKFTQEDLKLIFSSKKISFKSP